MAGLLSLDLTLEMYLRSLVLVLGLYFVSAAFCYGLLYKWNYLKRRKLMPAISENLKVGLQIRYSVIYLFGAAFLILCSLQLHMHTILKFTARSTIWEFGILSAQWFYMF